MNRIVYGIEIRSVRSAVEHLQAIDMPELAACAVTYGSDADRELIDALVRCLPTIPSV